MSYDPSDLLHHILDEINYLVQLINTNDFKSFLDNESHKRGAVRSFEIIGEASKKFDVDFKTSRNEIPWKEMAGMRDKLIHDYIDVDYWIVWQAMDEDIPELKIKIETLLKELNNG